MLLTLFFLLALLIALIIVFFSGRNALNFAKYRILFNPTRARGLSAPSLVQDFSVPSGKEQLHSWLYRTPNSAPLVIFCHGNNGNISERQYMLNLAEIAKFNLVLFDYAGYGQSTGSPSLPQIELDSLAIYDRFVPLFPHSKIIIWGESLGSHAATTIAKYRKIHHLLILAGFSSFEDVPRYTRDGIVGQLASLAVRSLTEVEPSVVKAKAITAPVIVIHSTEDTFIPYRCAQILYEAFAGPKQFVTVTGDHATPDLTPEILTKLCLDVGISVPTRSQLEAWLVELKKTGKYFLAQFQMGH